MEIEFDMKLNEKCSPEKIHCHLFAISERSGLRSYFPEIHIVCKDSDQYMLHFRLSQSRQIAMYDDSVNYGYNI